MHLVLTNDDGFDAPGILALYQAATLLPGVTVRVIAPSVAYSGKGHVVSPQFFCHETQTPGIGRVTVVDGTPADCVRAAIALPGEPRPDWVLAGVNHGSNLGIDVFYSGTVAAAREAAILGIPAIALSKLVKSTSPTDWDAVTRACTVILAALMRPEAPPPPGVEPTLHCQVAEIARTAGESPGFWSVNLPTPVAEPRALKPELTKLSTDPLQVRYEETLDEHGRRCFTSKGNYHERPASPGTDVASAFGGKVSITRVAI